MTAEIHINRESLEESREHIERAKDKDFLSDAAIICYGKLEAALNDGKGGQFAVMDYNDNVESALKAMEIEHLVIK
jgi:hypothetical protein